MRGIFLTPFAVPLSEISHPSKNDVKVLFLMDPR